MFTEHDGDEFIADFGVTIFCQHRVVILYLIKKSDGFIASLVMALSASTTDL